MKYRHRVSGFLILLFAITYIDRVCISVAGPRMQEDLGIDPVGWGWVTAMFNLSYCIFEIPTGTLGDRIGPRRVLTRIVIWWSAFTALTGAVSNYYLLLITRFLFGAGEAGAFPNASIVVSRWFPPTQRASMSGVMLMASQIGGGIAPLLIVPIQMRYGWRASFFIFGVVGLLWAAAWYAWFRDSPAEKPGVSPEELAETQGASVAPHHGFPWRHALRSETVWAMMCMAFCYVYVYSFFQNWLHTFLVRGRGFTEGGPRALGAPVRARRGCQPRRRRGERRARSPSRPDMGPPNARDRRARGVPASSPSRRCSREHPMVTIVLLALVYGAITFQQSGVFGTCLDIGRTHAGSIVGLMNTAAQVGGLLSSVAYGYIVESIRQL